MKNPFLSLLLVLSVALAGCETNSVSGEAPRAPIPSQRSISIAHPDSRQVPEDPDQAYQEFQGRAEMRRDIRTALAQAEGWKDAEARIQSALAAHSDVPAYMVQQYVATMMLQTELLPESPTDEPDRLDAIGRYTDMLVANRNPNSALIDQSLGALEGHWSQERISRTASDAYDAAERFIEAKTDCGGCGIGQARQSAAGATSNEYVLSSLSGAIQGAERLRERF